jgi:adenosyl cobinamide kinase/adenosyl cobinamide phosphate guanylyltransferase
MYPYPRSPFSRFAKWTAHAAGHPLAFVFAAGTIGVADHRTAVWLQRHLAARHQYWHHDCFCSRPRHRLSW